MESSTRFVLPSQLSSRHSHHAARLMSESTDPAQLTNAACSSLDVPQQLGSWRICGQIGCGRLTTVYQARPADAERGASYAIKVLDRCYESDPEIVNLFRREAAAGRTLENPHLVSVLDCQIQSPPYYIVMPELCGQTLAAHLDRTWRASPLAAAWIARQIAIALAAIDAENFIHGDLKPANVHIAPNGHVTLLDLGFVQRPTPSHSTDSALGVGSARYAAPEVLLGGEGRDIRSDIYSLGAVLYEMLTGQPPLAANSLAELIEQHRQGRIADVRRLRRDIPCEMAELVGEMLARQPLRRPASPAEVARRLVRIEIGLFESTVAA
jgi:serine/threonine-protein kinase